MYTIIPSTSGSGFILNGAAPRPKGEQYEILKFGEKIAIREIVSNEMIASSKHFSEWNNGAYGDVDSAIADIESIIFSGDSAILGDILAEIQTTNDILVNQTNVLLQEILDSNVAQEALITSANNLLTDINTALNVLHNDNLITNQELADINVELNNINTLLSNIEAQDAAFYSDLLNCLNDIKIFLDNINANTDNLENQLNDLINQTDQVETLLGTIVATLNANSTLNVAKLEEIRALLESINANTDDIETQLATIIGEHDQTQVILNQIRIKPNETEILICVPEKQIALNTFEKNSTENFDSNITFIDGYAQGLRLEVPDGEDEVDATYTDLTEGYENTLSFDLEFGAGDSSSTNNLIVSVLDANDNSVLASINISESNLDINNYSLKFKSPASEEVIVRFNTANLDAEIFIDNVSIKQNSVTGSLVKQFDDVGNEILANRKFYIKGIEVVEPADWCEGPCQLDNSSLLEQNNILLENVYSELQAINGNTNDIEPSLDALQVAINTQTNTLETAINLVQQEINTASANEVAELQAIQVDLSSILAELLSINSNIQSGNITINNILNAVNELISVTADKLDTINQSIEDNGLTLDAINVNIQKVIDAIEQLRQDLLNSLDEVKQILSDILVKPNETEILICAEGKETLSLVKEFDENGDEIVANRIFYDNGVQIAEPKDWTEGNCVIFRLDELISLTQAGNATTNEISGNIQDIVKLLQSIDENTDEVEKLLTEIDSSIDAVIPYIDDVEKLLEDLNKTNSEILQQVTPVATTQFITKLDTTGQDISFGAGKVAYVDVVIVGTNQTGTVEINNSGNDLIELDSEVLFKYERKFDTYQNKVSPHDITVTYLGDAKGYMLVEFGLL